MKLNLKLEISTTKEKAKKEKKEASIQKAIQQEKEKQFQPSWNEIWHSGYVKNNGTYKEAILKTKISEIEKGKLEEVKKAIEAGEIGAGIEDLKKFTKAHAFNLYKQLQEMNREKDIKEMIDNKPNNYYCITGKEEFEEMLELLRNEEIIGLDTETTGLATFGTDKIVGLSMSLKKADKHYYIPVRHNVKDAQLNAEYVFTGLKESLENEKIGKVLHEAKFDAHFLRKEGIELAGIIMDTMISFHILSENEMSYALKNLATKWGSYFGFEDKSRTYESLFGKGGFENTPLDIGTVYACKDTHLVINFYDWIMTHLEKQPKLLFIHQLETKIINVVIEMEKNGFSLNTEYAEIYKNELREQVEELERELKIHFGDINLNSSAQLKHKLFNEFKLTDRNKGSVDAATLKALKKEHKGIEVLLQYRELTKLLNTYIEPLPFRISPLDNRLHGQFKQTGTVTGRFSSSDPNLQNIPYNARKLFTAEKGNLLMGCDFSKVEPTILAHMTGDPIFKEPFLNGIDIYSSLAANTFHKSIEDCGDGTIERKKMKVGLLAVMYGTSMYTLAEQLGVTIEEAEEFINQFLRKYNVVSDWIDLVHTKVDEKEYVETLYGRKRRFQGQSKIAKQFKIAENEVVKILGRKPLNIFNEKVPYDLKQAYWKISKEYFRASRQSVNAIIQGSGADIMKMAMINVFDLFKKWNEESEDRKFKMTASVHDEILMEVPESITIDEIEQIENAMKTCVTLSLPLLVDTEIGKIWGQGVSKIEHFKNNKEAILNEKR